MAFNSMGLVFIILTCSYLPSAAIFNRIYKDGKLDRYFDEWMADEGSTQSTATDSNITTRSQDVTSPSPPKAEAVGFINNQERLLNAVALIKEVLESTNTSEQNKEANKTDLFKLSREVFRPGQKNRLTSGFGRIYDDDEDETEKDENGFNEKAPNYADHAEKQMKLKKAFWDTNRDKYLNSLSSSGKNAPGNQLTSDNQQDTFDRHHDRPQEEMEERPPRYKRKREGNLEASPSMTRSVNASSIPSTTESATSSTEDEKSFVRRHLLLNRRARFGQNSRSGNVFNIRRKRIGELNFDTGERIERNSDTRRCGGNGIFKRDVFGCDM